MTLFHGSHDTNFRVIQPNHGGRRGRCYHVSAYYSRVRRFHVQWDDGTFETILETDALIESGDSNTPTLEIEAY